MEEEDILRFKSYSRVLPGIPFAKHTPQAGSTTSCSANGQGSSAVKVLALMCTKDTSSSSKRNDANTDDSDQKSSKRPRDDEGTEDTSSGADEKKSLDAVECTSAPRRRRLYVRVQYDGALVETLPMELFREKHPQILIDYLLSCSVWS